MIKGLTKNTGKFSGLIFRREWLRTLIWLAALAILTFSVAVSFTEMFPDKADRLAMLQTMKNPAMEAMVGPLFSENSYTFGAMMANQMLLFTALAFAIMSILFVARYTRADEEAGRIEMIRSLPVGRLFNLNGTLIAVSVINVLFALVIGFGLYIMNIESMDLEGSLLYGSALGATGIFFAGVAALFAQLSENARGTIGFSITILGIAYILRAIGDTGDGTLSWVSPLGWILESQSYVNNYWWPVLLTVFTAVILMLLALYLNAIRDLGAGFLPSRPGKNYATRFLQSPIGLALRIQRTSIISWAVGMFVIGASYGSVFGDLETFFSEMDIAENLINRESGYSLTEQFATILMAVMAMIGTVPALMAVLKLKGEEKKGRVEHFLSRAVSRTKLLGCYVAVGIIVSFLMQSLAVIGLWAAAASVMENGLAFGMLYQSAAVYFPAMWVIVGAAVFLIGYKERLTGITWLYLTYSFVAVYLGEMLNFPEWMGKVSPFGHVPQIPVEDMSVTSIGLLTVIAVALIFAGYFSYNKRDIHG
ncbi:ABC transporter permease [Virgibacillus siamensis]|uniref:ABC transporter permease n=1 Tax=Virgibacillus siamensis TaxID=480071 RepID=UPI0009868055|nr:ABC transporter permease [Virgibacillus siamensis]